jgi:hypothetical protein
MKPTHSSDTRRIARFRMLTSPFSNYAARESEPTAVSTM